MLKPLWLHLDTLAERVRSAAHLYVGCDFDGTLTDIVPHPDLAKLPERTRKALDVVARLPGAHLAVFSGRPLEDLRSRAFFEGAFLSGIAGLETLDSQGQRRMHVAAEDSIAEDVRDVMRQWCARFEGAWFEDKGPAFAVHYRAVPERFQPAFCSGVRRRFAGDPPRARLLHGKKVFDVLPVVDRDKASALADWVDRPDGVLFYFGDDANDEPVYPRVRDRGGISVAIGRWASHAEYGLTTPEHVTWFLEWLAREWTDSRAAAGLATRESSRMSSAATETRDAESLHHARGAHSDTGGHNGGHAANGDSAGKAAHEGAGAPGGAGTGGEPAHHAGSPPENTRDETLESVTHGSGRSATE
jgi:trehalose 6-phosphate phosphatase